MDNVFWGLDNWSQSDPPPLLGQRLKYVLLSLKISQLGFDYFTIYVFSEGSYKCKKVAIGHTQPLMSLTVSACTASTRL